VVNPGAEVIADGHIHVYAPLRGRAIAGAKGDGAARIFTTCMQAELLSIAGVYCTGEAALPSHLLGKAVQVRMHDDQLVVEPLAC
jgi:septum site-determining protein MinC